MADEIVTRTRRYSLGDDGILRTAVLPDVEETMADAIENVRAMKSLVKGRRYPVLADMRLFKGVDREVRAYYAGPETTGVVSAVAIIVRSLAQRVMGNWFITWNKPQFPSRLFTSQDEAMKWLDGFRQ